MQLLRRLLNDSKKEHWVDGLQWCWWNVLGLLPILVTFFMLALTKHAVRRDVFMNNGEFALYSASFLGATLYLVMKDFRKSAFPSRKTIVPILVLILVGASILYAQIALLAFLGESGTPLPDIDKEVIQNISLVLLPVAFLLAYISVVADGIRVDLDLKQVAENQFQAFTREFDGL